MKSVSRALTTAALFAAWMIVPHASWAQTATISGSLSAFDVVNDTGQPVHGFEIQLEGAQPGDLYYTVFGGRYGTPSVTPYATGVYIRYQSPYDASSGQYSQTTAVNNAPSFQWQDCYQGGAGYGTSGCEHFGQSMRPIPAGRTITVTGHWLVGDTANPGTLIPVNSAVAIPFASWSVLPSTTFGAAPVVVAEVEAPEPPETPETYGDAQWVRIYKTQLNREVTADELTSINPAVVPEGATQIEVAWDILQASPPSNGNQTRTRNRNQGGIAADTRAIIRRYEVYKYTGAYDATTHQVACADTTCTAPSAGELGGPLSAQNIAINITADTLTVVKSGNGNVSGANGKISCGNVCAAFTPTGSALTLTASPASGVVFAGWSGACSGTQSTCSVTAGGQLTANASFKSQFTLSIGRSNSGTVTGDPAGNDRAINCPGNCSAKFTEGTVVTLTAIPPAGKQFANWSGGCSGTALTCTLTIAKDTSVQAVFSK